MVRDDLDIYYRILELGQYPSKKEVLTAYHHLKKLYSSDSIVTAPLGEELSPESRAHILNQIEEAYAKLNEELFNGQLLSQDLQESAKTDTGEQEEHSGSEPINLRDSRENQGYSLAEIALATRISHYTLECLEEEKFAELPPETYLKSHLQVYADFLSLKVDTLLEEYMDRYSRWKQNLHTRTEGKGE